MLIIYMYPHRVRVSEKNLLLAIDTSNQHVLIAVILSK